MSSSPPAEPVPQAALDASYVRNTAAIVSWEAIWGIGVPCCLLPTVVPAYLLSLGASKTLVQVVMVSFSVATVIQLVAVKVIHGPRRRQQVCAVWALFSLAWLGYGALATLAWDRFPAGVWMAIFLLMCVVLAVTMNLGSPTYNELVLQNIALRKRGRLGAYRLVTLGLTGLGGVALAAWLMSCWEEPHNYHHTILIGATIMLVSCASILFVRDVAQESQPPASGPRIRPLLRTLAGNMNFRVILLFHAMQTAALSLSPLLIGYGQDVGGMGSSQVAWFSGAFFAGPILAGVLVLPLADHFGFRLVAILNSLVTIAGFILAFFVGGSQVGIVVAYVLCAIPMNSLQMVIANLGMESIPDIKPAVILAAANLLVMPLSLVIAPLSGRLVDIYGTGGYVAAFAVGCVLSISSLLGFLFLVREPRSGQEIYIRIRPLG